MRLRDLETFKYTMTPDQRYELFRASGKTIHKGEVKKKGDYKGAVVKCEQCGKEFYVYPCRLKKGAVKYCSLECRNENLKGEKNPFFGHHHSEDFIRKHKARMVINPPPGRPPNNIRSAGQFRYTLNWKGKTNIKKFVKACERCGWDRDPSILLIHHKNRNRTDNNDTNIEIICPNCHCLEHKRYIAPLSNQRRKFKGHKKLQQKEVAITNHD